jgi:protein phosphatase
MASASSETVPAGAPGLGAAIQGGRAAQQDSFRSVWLSGENAWLLIVADGMGGHAAGAVASRIAADTFVSAFTAKREAGASLEQALEEALEDANQQIARAQEEAPETAGMGTTLVAAYVSPQGVAWISVGDSPLWLIRKGTIERMNEDHSFRPAVAKGAKASANVLQSALNGDEIALIDLQPKPRRLRTDDVVIMASDGLLTLTEREIASCVVKSAHGDAETIARTLLQAVEQRAEPNQDNCTVLVAAAAGPDIDAHSATSSVYGLIGAATVILAGVASIAGYLFWRAP